MLFRYRAAWETTISNSAFVTLTLVLFLRSIVRAPGNLAHTMQQQFGCNNLG